MVTFRRLLSPLLLFSPPTAVAAFTFLSIFPSKSYTKKKIIRIGASTAGTTNASPSLLWVSLHNCKRIRQQSRYSSSSLNDRATDDDLEERYKKVRPDMKYIPRNVMRQHGNFEAIRNAAGSDLTNDVYVRAPQSATKIMAQTFWFVGKGKNKRRLILAFYYFIRCEQFELTSHLAAFIVSCTMCPSRARVRCLGGPSGRTAVAPH